MGRTSRRVGLLLACLVALVVALGAAPAAARAETVDSGPDGNISWTLDGSGALTISGEG